MIPALDFWRMENRMENGEGYITIPTHRIESATWQLHTLLSRPIATATCFEAPEHPCQKLQTFGYSWQNLSGCCTESRSPTPTCLCICSLACYLEIQNRRWLKSKGRKKKAKKERNPEQMMQYGRGFRRTTSQLQHSRIFLVLPAGSKTGLITPYVSP